MDKEEHLTTRANGVRSIDEVRRIHNKALPMPKEYANFLGALPHDKQFLMALYGSPGAGKSTFSLHLANALTQHGYFMYCCFEEPTDRGTLQVRLKKSGVVNKRIYFADCKTLKDIRNAIEQMKENNRYPRFVCIDSVNTVAVEGEQQGYDLHREDERAVALLRHEYPDISFIYVVQMNKDRSTMRGMYDWEHNVDIPIRCEVRAGGERWAVNSKPRFGCEDPEMYMFTLKGSVSESQGRRDRNKLGTSKRAEANTFREIMLERRAKGTW